jgi:tRNA pseudouridine38-40 synthase
MDMGRLKATVAYDGTQFSGYQVQPNKRTVQSELQSALVRMHKGEPIQVTASGRTDAGVHAKGQVFHFDSPLEIPSENWCRALNTMVPGDIQFLAVEKASDKFHARYDVLKKEYRYRILRSTKADVFRRSYTWHVDGPLDLTAMESAARAMTGTHDFTSFCASNTSVKDKVRTVYSCEIMPEKDEWVIRVTGTGFLYQMVRIMVGTLIDTGRGKLTGEDVMEIIENKDRRTASRTAPPQGLFLWSVNY